MCHLRGARLSHQLRRAPSLHPSPQELRRRSGLRKGRVVPGPGPEEGLSVTPDPGLSRVEVGGLRISPGGARGIAGMGHHHGGLRGQVQGDQVGLVPARHAASGEDGVRVVRVAETEAIDRAGVGLAQPAVAVAVPEVEEEGGAAGGLLHSVPGGVRVVEPADLIAGLGEEACGNLGLRDVDLGVVMPGGINGTDDNDRGLRRSLRRERAETHSHQHHTQEMPLVASPSVHTGESYVRDPHEDATRAQGRWSVSVSSPTPGCSTNPAAA